MSDYNDSNEQRTLLNIYKSLIKNVLKRSVKS